MSNSARQEKKLGGRADHVCSEVVGKLAPGRVVVKFISDDLVKSCTGWGFLWGPAGPWCEPWGPQLGSTCCSRCSSSFSDRVHVLRWCCRGTWLPTRKQTARWQPAEQGLWQETWRSGGGCRRLQNGRGKTEEWGGFRIKTANKTRGLTNMSVSHHALGPVPQVLPHVCHQLVDPLHWKWNVVLVVEAVVSQCLGDTFTHGPQSLERWKWKCINVSLPVGPTKCWKEHRNVILSKKV